MADFVGIEETEAQIELVYNIAGAGGITYVNRVFDDVAGDFVRWNTVGMPDPAGASYPGPDAFGNTTDYCVESRIFG